MLLEAGANGEELPESTRFITPSFYKYLEHELKVMRVTRIPHMYTETDLLLQAAYSLLFKKIIKHV